MLTYLSLFFTHFLLALVVMKLTEHYERGPYGELWATAAADMHEGLKIESLAMNSMPKPDWMTSREKLLAAAERAVKLYPSYCGAWGMLGDALVASDKNKNHQRAIECYNKAADLAPHQVKHKYLHGANVLEAEYIR